MKNSPKLLLLFSLFLLQQFVIQINSKDLDIAKCCNRGEVYDIASSKCIKRQLPNINEDYPMDPAFHYFDTEAPETQNVDDLFTRFESPECTNGAEKRKALNEMTEHVHIDADAHDFFIDVEHDGILFVHDGMHFTQHGYLDYCLERGFKDDKYIGTLALHCHIPIEIECKTKTCINACCGLGFMYDLTTHECVTPVISRSSIEKGPQHSPVNDSNKLRMVYDPDHLPLYKGSGEKLDPRDTNFMMVYEAPKCMTEHGYHAYNYTDKNLHLFTSGEILIKDKKFDRSQYCLVHIVDDLNGHFLYQAKVCIDPKSQQPNKENSATNHAKPNSFVLLVSSIYLMIIKIYHLFYNLSH